MGAQYLGCSKKVRRCAVQLTKNFRCKVIFMGPPEDADVPNEGNVRDIVAENSSLNGNRRCDGMSPEHVALNF